MAVYFKVTGMIGTNKLMGKYECAKTKEMKEFRGVIR